MSRSRLFAALLVVVGFTILIQFVPVPSLRHDPPVLAQPSWNSPLTRSLAVRACYDCHSNRTRWPWYSRIAPVSWLVAHHVAEGRAALDFSATSVTGAAADRAARAVRSGRMPPLYYSWLHPTARLTAHERQTLADGLVASFGGATSQELTPAPPPNKVVPAADMAPVPGGGAPSVNARVSSASPTPPPGGSAVRH